MFTSLLSTKLYIPRARAKVVSRPRLVERLLAGMDDGGRMILLSGPAGFGKTTLLSEFVAQLRRPAAWVSLDEADNDPVRFWTYLIAAGHSACPDLGETALTLLQSPQPFPPETIPTLLINDLTRPGTELALVLDDYHVIQNQSVHAACAFLVEHLPPGLSVVVSTRADPPWPLARFRARNQLTELRAADLRFTPEEAAAFLSQTMSLELTVEDIAALEARTEGWIAGLQLAAIALQAPGRSDRAGFVKAFAGSHVFVAEYLVEEVLQRQSQEAQAFLLQTSVLKRLSDGLCDAITGRKDGQAALAALQKENLFIVPLDDDGHWFRYHHLFADLLRARLKQHSTPAEIAALHQRAAQWYERAAMPGEAIEHAQAAADYALIARVVESIGLQMILQGYVRTVEGWLRVMPLDYLERSPKANLLWTWLYLLRGPAEQAAPYVERLAAFFASPQSAEADPALRGEWLTVQAKRLNLRGEMAQSRDMSRQALAILPTAEAHVRNLAYLELATAYQQLLEYDQAAETFQMIARDAQAAGDPVADILGTSGQGRMLLQLGKLRRCFEIASEGIKRLEASGKVTPFSATLYGEIGSVYFQWHQLDQAKAYFQRSSESSGQSGYSDPEIYWHVTLSRIHQMEGDREASALEMEKANALAREIHPAMTQEGIVCQQVRVDLASERIPEAQARLEAKGFVFKPKPQFPGLAPGARVTYPAGLLYNSALRVLLAKASLEPIRKEAVNNVLETATMVLEAALQCQLLSVALETFLVRSQVHALLGDEVRRLADVAKALEFAKPEGFISIFVEEGPPIAEALTLLLKRHRLEGTQADYVHSILAAFPQARRLEPGQEQARRAPAAGDETEALPEPLTPRELEVLRLIAAGASNRKIAETLVITVSAVKKHTSNIFGKLGVNSRTQAVARARRLNLLLAD